MQDCVNSILVGYLKKIIYPKQRHYAYLRMILIPYGIEPALLPNAGPKAWRIAERAYADAKLSYWASLCKHFSKYNAEITDLKTLFEYPILDNGLTDNDADATKREYTDRPYVGELSIRNFTWRTIAQNCPKIGAQSEHKYVSVANP